MLTYILDKVFWHVSINSNTFRNFNYNAVRIRVCPGFFYRALTQVTKYEDCRLKDTYFEFIYCWYFKGVHVSQCPTCIEILMHMLAGQAASFLIKKEESTRKYELFNCIVLQTSISEYFILILNLLADFFHLSRPSHAWSSL